MNHVIPTEIPKYLRNAPSINESGGIFPNTITANSDTTNSHLGKGDREW